MRFRFGEYAGRNRDPIRSPRANSCTNVNGNPAHRVDSVRSDSHTVSALTTVSLQSVVNRCVTASIAPRTLNRFRPDGPRIRSLAALHAHPPEELADLGLAPADAGEPLDV